MGLLETIEKKYPKGTQFYDLVKNRLFTSSGQFPNFKPNDNQVYMSVQSNEHGNHSARVFNNGQYAKIKQNTFELWTY